MSKQSEYAAALKRLPISNPTLEDALAICPHLTRAEVEAIVAGADVVACPPVITRERVNLIHFKLGYCDRDDGHYVPPAVDHAFSSSSPNQYKFGPRALAYAMEHWPTNLDVPAHAQVLRIILDDPSQLSQEGYPASVGTLYVALDADLNELRGSADNPRSVVLDAHTIAITDDRWLGVEFAGNCAPYTDFNCSRCGSGLSLSGCSGCRLSFSDNGIRSGWRTPLSRKMVAFLREQGHQFAIDPEIAWQHEAGILAETEALRAAHAAKAAQQQ